MSADEFFESPDKQNIVKTRIVSKYFGAWSKIMLARGKDPKGRIAYIDLFSGPGRYSNGAASTPVWVLNQAIQDSKLASRLVTLFNDKDQEYAVQLQAEISAIPGIKSLTYEPEVSNVAIGSEVANLFRNLTLVPTLFFIDPWGYKGLSLDLIGATIRSWGCDCIFFFNYNRINAGLTNPFVLERMKELFGDRRAEALRKRVGGLSPEDRQTIIISELSEALKEVGGKFVLPFEFESQYGERTSHYIIFVSKAFLGYHIMKEVMFSLSSDSGDVRHFEYVPVKSSQMSMFPDFGRSHSMPLLKSVLLQTLAGQTLNAWNVYEEIAVDTPYTLKNIKDAIIQLEAEKRVIIDKPASKRMRQGKVTLGDSRTVTFPSSGG